MLATLKMLEPHAMALGVPALHARLCELIKNRDSDAMRQRAAHERLGSLNDVMRQQSQTWMGQPPAPV